MYLYYINIRNEYITDLFMYLYDEEFYIDTITDCIYSTNFKDTDRIKLNFTGIAMEYERLCVLCENKILSSDKLDTIIECITLYGYDIERDYKYQSDDIYETASNIIERLNQVFGL